MDYSIAIPSYQRPQELLKKTLTMLKNENIDPSIIYVFVVPEEEQIYRQTIPDGYCKDIVVGVIGLPEQRNFIYDYFPLGTRILMIDDDIKEVRFVNKIPLDDMIRRMWKITEEEGASLWSIYPVANLFFCKDRVVIGKVFCVGCFHGVVNDRLYYIQNCGASEDRWNTLTRFLRDGKTLRYEGCCPITTYFAKGGLTDYRKTRQYEDTVLIHNMFPTLTTLKQKKNGVWDADIKLKVERTRNLC